MKAMLGFIAVVSFIMVLNTAEELGIVFVLSLVAFACSMIKFNNIKE